MCQLIIDSWMPVRDPWGSETDRPRSSPACHQGGSPGAGPSKNRQSPGKNNWTANVKDQHIGISYFWIKNRKRSNGNSDLLNSAMSCILPSSEKFLLPDDITQFAALLKVNASDSAFRSECDVAAWRFIIVEIEGKVSVPYLNYANFYFPWRQRFNSVYKLYAGALAFSASTAVCEA